jgi:hypothetical protein
MYHQIIESRNYGAKPTANGLTAESLGIALTLEASAVRLMFDVVTGRTYIRQVNTTKLPDSRLKKCFEAALPWMQKYRDKCLLVVAGDLSARLPAKEAVWVASEILELVKLEDYSAALELLPTLEALPIQ